MKRKSKKTIFDLFVEKHEWIAYLLLGCWCLLPFVMSIINMVRGFQEEFPTFEELESWGLPIGNLYYNATVSTYQLLFHILGVISIVFVLLVIIFNFKNIFNKNSIKQNPWFFLLLGLLAYGTLTSLLSADPWFAFTGDDYLCSGLSSYYIYAAILILGSLLSDETYRLKIMKLFVIVMTYLSILVIIEELGNEFLLYCFPSYRTAVFNQFNHFGYMLCMTLLTLCALYLFDEEGNKYLYIADFCFILFTLLINDTFGSYLGSAMALVVVYVFYYLSGRKMNVKAFLPVILFVSISALNILGVLPLSDSLATSLSTFLSDLGKVATQSEGYENAGTGRLTLWKDTIEKIIQKPILGYGACGFHDENAITNGDSPHNEYLQMIAYVGIPGFLLYISSLITLCRRQIKDIKKIAPSVLISASGLVAYLASACFGNPVFNSAPYYYLFFGLTTFTLNNEVPLLGLDPNKVIPGEEYRVRKNKIFSMSLIVITAAALLFGVKVKVDTYTESKLELQDLETLKIAYSLAIEGYQEGELEVYTEYYFDVDTYSFTTEWAPTYGVGTSLKGNTYEDFCNEAGIEFYYDEETDYTDKVVHMYLSGNENNELVIDVWFE